MFIDIFRFELNYRFRRPLLYFFAAAFFAMTFWIISSESLMIGGSATNVARNAPFVITNVLLFMSMFGMISVAFFVAPSANRDHELGLHELFFSTPVGKSAYLLGRFIGSVVPVVAMMLAACMGIILAGYMPWQDPEHIAPFSVWPYLYTIAIFIIPNLYLAGAIFFSIATLTKKTFSAYVAVIVFIILYIISKVYLSNLENQATASMIDPFGWSSFRIMTDYWTIAEKNTRMPPFSGILLFNRILWISIGTFALYLTFKNYRMVISASKIGTKSLKKLYKETQAQTGIDPLPMQVLNFTEPSLGFTPRARFIQYLHQTMFETRSILQSTPFLVIMMFGGANLIGVMLVKHGGVASYPLTHVMLRCTVAGFFIYPMLVIAIYGADLIWKDRRIRINEIRDTLPVPNWVPLMSRLTSLFLISFLMLAFAMICSMVFQMTKSYFNFELGLYFKALFLIMLSDWILYASLAIFCQVLAGNMPVGTLLFVLYLFVQEVPADLGYEHNLLVFPMAPEAPYSDMNGYGHFAVPLFWFRIYWALLAVGMIIISNWLWVRGTDNRLVQRLRKFRRRMTRRSISAFAMSALGFLAVGSWIFYNTNVLNVYRSSKDITRLTALYEKRYKQYENLPQPKITSVKLNVDIYPESRRMDIRGNLLLANYTDTAIGALHLFLDPDVNINNLSFPYESIEIDDREVGYHVYNLDTPLEPGDSLDLNFDIYVERQGFVNNDSDVRIVGNGTFFNNSHFIPVIGYFPDYELNDPDKRKKQDLPERARMANVNDPDALDKISHRDADRIDFEAIVSTSPDQITIAPGYLQREWMENGRRYFHYKMDAPILNFYAFVSGRYEVERGKWKDIPIEVYYHKPHHVNVARMIESVQKSLDYYTSNFGPFQHRQMRIIEFPGYRSFAQSFPNTVPYSEAIHFIDDLRDEDNLDKVFYVTAHEVAHQWWGHQVIGAEVQGCQMIVESMAQYSALMVMEKDYGRDQMKQFLRYELDKYLKGRGQEMIDEMPLMLVEDQPYIFYNKGSLVMYALREYIGEDTFNAALRKYIKKTAFQGPPYTNSIEYLSYIRETVPERYKYLIEDLLETITLYDNRTVEATSTKTDDGRYIVKLTFHTHKMRADGKGIETEIGHNDWIEIGVYGEEVIDGKTVETTLYQKKHKLKTGSGEIEITVDEKPVRAGIDPRNLLIDRIPKDNTKRVSG